MILETFPVGMLQCNCSVFGDESTGEALVIDPGDEIERVVAVVRRHGLRITMIVVTHAHIDHIGGAKKLRDLTGAPVHMNANDAELYETLEMQAAWIGMRHAPERGPIDVPLQDGDTLTVGGATGTVLHTPGHTQGSVSLYFPMANEKNAKKLFAGDTLFQGSIGRTDLPGGNTKQIFRSIRDKLLVLPDDTVVIPGHGDRTTIGEERESNPFLKGL
jgi:hydroxyacylglutathione hydrolase